jgi:type IV pilus assembly protein PilE
MWPTRQRGTPRAYPICPPRESKSRRDGVRVLRHCASACALPASCDPLASARGRGDRGFTLIELVIAVVIVGILAAIALPAYTQQILRANRAQAKQFMEDIANRQEQYLLDQRSYTATIGTGGLGMTAPQETSGRYTFAAAAGGNDCLGVALPTPGYSITATAVGAQASDGNLCLDSVNHKIPTDKWQR